VSQRTAAEIRREIEELTRQHDDRLGRSTNRALQAYLMRTHDETFGRLRAELAAAERREVGNG